LYIVLSDFEWEIATQASDYIQQVVPIVIRGIPTVLEFHFMCLCMTLGRIALQGSESANLFDLIKDQADLQQVAVGIKLPRNINLVTDIVPPCIHFTPLLGWHPTHSICYLVELSPLCEFRSQCIGCGHHRCACSTE
jgi:hypothetical protein